MVKRFSLLITLTVAIGAAFCLSGAGRLQADPSDDFSFSLTHSPQVKAYSLLSERRVKQILADHLDEFPRSQVEPLARHLVSLCRKYRFDPAFVLSLIQVESSFRIRALSPMGAVGLMQVMPATGAVVARNLGLKIKITERVLQDPFVNLTLGVAYLAWLRDHYHGLSPYYLVAAYNVGPAKLDELRSRKSFKPVNTKKYYEAIRRGVPGFRFYKGKAPAKARRRAKPVTERVIEARRG